MATTFLEALHSGRVLLMDGAMGSELQRAGMQPGECYELWNLTHPDRVLAIHQAYVDAGAEVLLTNTFQANPPAFAKHQLQHQMDVICQSAVRLARQAGGIKTHILADIGPFKDTGDEVIRVVEGLSRTHDILMETLSNFFQVESVAIRQRLLVSFTYLHNNSGGLQTFPGQNPEVVAQRASALGVAALGVNCGRDITMDDCAEIIRRYRTVTDLPLFARPNAGTPTKIDNQWVYPRTPEQMAAELPKLLEAGVSMVGGCCGTTPAHIAAFRRVVDDWNAKKHAARS
ncbi:MAG TPA: homocysteine S-methyltransferase family protein [Gemmataceae bacterium]|nr:homocysteine S-methyltransferase family protein [Gemmataceae bacterium]